MVSASIFGDKILTTASVLAFPIAQCWFHKIPDMDFSNSRTVISENPGQGFH